MSCFYTNFGCAGNTGAGGIGRFAAKLGGQIVAAAVLSAAIMSGCGDKPSNPVSTGDDGGAYGAIVIRGRVDAPKLAKTAAAQETAKPTKLLITVSGAGFDTIRVESTIDFSRATIIDTIPQIPAGTNRRITILAVDQNGVVTHIDSIETHIVTVAANAVTPVNATLIPAIGSIYLLLNGLPTAVDSVWATFKRTNGATVAECRAKRGLTGFVSLNLDNIPHNTAGILRVDMVNASREYLYTATKELTFSARGDNNIDLQFRAPDGAAGINVDLRASGVTIGAYDFSSKGATTESGELVITEIMWNATDNNYIELYNPADAAFSVDTLIIDVDDLTHRYPNVNIAAKSFITIGRKYTAYMNIYTPSLYIYSYSNWISVKRKDGAVIDRVVFAGANNALGWPTMPTTTKKSIELAKDKYNAADNNYGKNWRVTRAGMIDGSQSLYGTPKTGADF